MSCDAEYRLELSEGQDDERWDLLNRSLKAFNDGSSDYFRLARTPEHAHGRFGIWIVGSSGRLHGGVTAIVRGLWGWIDVQDLWVEEGLRGLGYGRRLMGRVDQEAVRRSCPHISLQTFSFQAPGFYQKLGYRIVGRLEGCPPGQTYYWMRKDLEG